VVRTSAEGRAEGVGPGSRPWRLVLDARNPGTPDLGPPPADGPTNMAIDQALLEAVRDGAPAALRLYRWAAPTLSFGRNQPAAGLYDEAAARARGIAFVRRPTGGQAVLHADELTYAVVAPVHVIGRPRAAYRRINRALVAGLRRLGVAVEAAGAGSDAHSHAHPGPMAWSRACFRVAAEGEVVAGGRKLVGSAQRCEARVVLQHGSILLSGSQAAAEELLLADEKGPTPADPRPSGGAWTTLGGELGRKASTPALVAALVAGFEDVLGTALAPAGLSVEESARVRELCAQFASPAWTWRR
jgi:lipoyl(octanoyl) transferase